MRDTQKEVMTVSIKQTAILLSMCPVILLISCSLAPVLNLDNEILPAKLGSEPYTQEEVQNAILRACNRRGWSAQVQDDGAILASIMVRTHRAKIEIRHTNSTISISYVDSEGLEYSRDQIHSNYNRWVANLYRTIQRELGSRAQLY